MADFLVTNTNDSGAGSLRQAIANANAAHGADKIIFDNSLSGSTINLTSGEIRIADNLTIEGLGSENITIDAGGNSRIFFVNNDKFSRGSKIIDVTLTGLTITGGSSSSDGGAIFASDGIRTSVNLNILDSEITNSTAGGDGGGVNAEGDVFINLSTFQDNTANNHGGGVYSNNYISFLTSTLSNNQANFQGGGIYTRGATIIINSNISDNQTSGSGGGISVDPGILNIGDRALIANTTISGNRAFDNGGGIKLTKGEITIDFGLGGNQLEPASNLVLTNVTITDNVADNNNDGIGDGGGIYNPQSSKMGSTTVLPGTLVLANSILAGNFDTPNNNGVGFIAPDISGSARGNFNNLLGDDRGLTQDNVQSSLLGTGTDLKNVNPGLGPLQDNGGFTLTHALLPGSPAINGGNNDQILRETFIDVDNDGRPQVLNFDGDQNTINTQLPYDQRTGEFARIVGGTVDIGAFERQEGENTEPENPDLIVPESVFLEDPAQYLGLLRDFDGNDLGAGDAWKSIGSIDVQGDGDIEYV